MGPGLFIWTYVFISYSSFRFLQEAMSLNLSPHAEEL